MKKTKGMKRVIAFMLTLTLAGMVSVACGTEATPKKETADEQKTEQEPAEEEEQDITFGLNETAVFDTLKITALEMKESEGDDFIKPAEGKVFVGVKFKIENVSEEDQNISSLMLFSAYVDDTKADTELMVPSEFSEGSLDGTLASGKSMEGYFVVQAGTEWQQLQLDVQSEWLSNVKAQFVLTK